MPDGFNASSVRRALALPARVWRRVHMHCTRRARDAALREELALHRVQLMDALRARGLSSADAAREAVVRMGDEEAARDAAHRVWSVRPLDTFEQDVIAALGGLRRHPVFTSAVIVALAGGIGVSAGTFAVYSALTLRSWDVPSPERLVSLFVSSPTWNGSKRDAGFSRHELDRFAQQARSLSGVFAYERRRPDGTRTLNPAPVSASYFTVLGVPMALGRGFEADDDRPDAPRAVLVVSDAYWREQLHGSPEALGATVLVQDVPFTVVGIAAPAFVGTDLVRIDAWMPHAAMPLTLPRLERLQVAQADAGACCLHLAARLAPGFSTNDAAAELTELLFAGVTPAGSRRSVHVAPYTMVHSSGPTVSREIVPAFLLLAGVSTLVLVLACCNAASLMLARSLARRGEVRSRTADGATRGRRVRQSLLESLSLAVLASAPALAIAVWSPPWLLRLATGVPMALPFAPDGRTLLVTSTLVLLSGVLFGVAPAVHATQEREPAAARSRLSPRLVGLQLMCSLALFVAAAVFVAGVPDGRSAQRLATVVAILVALFALLLTGTGVFGVVSYGAQSVAADRGARRAYGTALPRILYKVGAWRAHVIGLGLCGGASAAIAACVLLRLSLDRSGPLPHSGATMGLLALAALATLAMSLPLCRSWRAPAGVPLRLE